MCEVSVITLAFFQGTCYFDCGFYLVWTAKPQLYICRKLRDGMSEGHIKALGQKSRIYKEDRTRKAPGFFPFYAYHLNETASGRQKE